MATANLIQATENYPQVLVSQQLAATETTQYQCPTNKSVVIASASLANTSGATVTVAVSVVKAAGTAGNANRILAPYDLRSGDDLELDKLRGVLLGPGDFISATASAATSVAFVMSGAVSS